MTRCLPIGLLIALLAGPAQADPDERTFSELVDIGQVTALAESDGKAPRTFLLPERSVSQNLEVAPNIRVLTRCVARWCVDGLEIDGKVAIAPLPTDEEQTTFGVDAPAGHRLERVIKLAFDGRHHVSVYLVENQRSGGVHATSHMRCLTFDRPTKKLVTLHHVIEPAMANRLLLKTKGLFEGDKALEVVGRPLTGATNWRPVLDASQFRFVERGATRAELVICAVPPGDTREMVELRVEEFPVRYLLQAH